MLTKILSIVIIILSVAVVYLANFFGNDVASPKLKDLSEECPVKTPTPRYGQFDTYSKYVDMVDANAFGDYSGATLPLRTLHKENKVTEDMITLLDRKLETLKSECVTQIQRCNQTEKDSSDANAWTTWLMDLVRHVPIHVIAHVIIVLVCEAYKCSTNNTSEPVNNQRHIAAFAQEGNPLLPGDGNNRREFSFSPGNYEQPHMQRFANYERSSTTDTASASAQEGNPLLPGDGNNRRVFSFSHGNYEQPHMQRFANFERSSTTDTAGSTQEGNPLLPGDGNNSMEFSFSRGSYEQLQPHVRASSTTHSS